MCQYYFNYFKISQSQLQNLITFLQICNPLKLIETNYQNFQRMNQDFDFYVPDQKIFGQQIKPFNQDNLSQKPCILMSGFPYDEGTKINGGRVGGAIASFIFRKTLLEHQIFPKGQTNIYDAGDIQKQQNLQKAHEELFQKQLQLLKQVDCNKGLLFSIGGSNDQSYPNVRALMECYPTSKIGVINIDQHFDVRPLVNGKAHSGSPFRQMLQHPLFHKNNSKFIQFAVKGATTSKSHLQFLQQNKADIVWLQKDIRKFNLAKQNQYRTQAGQLFDQIIDRLTKEQKCEFIFVSFDVDSINCKWMPGVSAPSVIGGITNDQAFQIMKISGKCTQVKLVDFSEFNPAVQSLVSSRLLVEMLFTLSQNFNQRK